MKVLRRTPWKREGVVLLSCCLACNYAAEVATDHTGKWSFQFQNVGYEINPGVRLAKALNTAAHRFNLSVDTGNYVSLRAFPGLNPVSKAQDLTQDHEDGSLPSVEQFLQRLNQRASLTQQREISRQAMQARSDPSADSVPQSTPLLQDSKLRRLNVYGKDKRTPFSWDVYPDRVFGKLAFPSAYYCTGQLIGKRHVLTAAHCFYSYGKQIDGENVYKSIFRAAYHTINGKHFFAAASNWTRLWYGTTYPEVYRNSDWAIIELEQPLGESQGYVGINPTDLHRQIPIYDKFELIGYSEDGWSQTAGKDASCSLEDAYQGVYFHNCDCAAGASGGALLDGDYNVVGINTAHIMPQDRTSLRGGEYNPSYPNIAVPTYQFMPTLAHILTQLQ